MRKFNLNWGVMLAAIVLLLYTYISFLGRLYQVDGVVWKAALFALVVIAIVATCVFVMVSAKVTKSKEIGLVGQIVFGCVILATFLVSGIPFTSFLKVAGSQDKIESEINKVKEAVSGLDVAYNKYAASRVLEYKQSLPVGSELKGLSLERRLCPDSIRSIQKQRQDWVARIGNMSIWNIQLPHNLKYMQQCVYEWTENYQQISSISYDGQSYKPFEYKEFGNSLETLMDSFSFKNAGYSFWAIIVAILAALVMMLPYWIAIPVKTRKGGPIIWKEQIRH